MSNYLGFKPSDNSKYYFVSYNNEDAARVGPIASALADSGVSLWYDYGLEYGEKWEPTIAEKIDNSKAVILFFTKGILDKKSSFVQKEYKMATLAYQKKIFVVLMDDIQTKDIPYDKMGWWLDIQELQCINAFSISNTSNLVVKIAEAIGENIQRQTEVPSSWKTTVSNNTDAKNEDFKKIIPRIDPAMLNSPEVLLALQKTLEDITARMSSESNVHDLDTSGSDRSTSDSSEQPSKDITNSSIPVPQTALNETTVLRQNEDTSVSEQAVSDGIYLPEGLKYRSINESSVIITDCINNLHSLTIPNDIDGKTVVGIDDFALNNDSIEHILIPATVTKIGSDCVRHCRNLQVVVLNSNISTIPEGFFANCKKLRSAILPPELQNIERYTFAGCSKLEEITIPKTVKFIGERAFYGTGLSSLTIPDSVAVIEPNAFEDCRKLREVTISGSLKVLPERLFLNCFYLSSVRIPDSVSEIRESAFMECQRLLTIDSLKNIKTIAAAAFQNCINLRQVTIPNIEFIGQAAFSGCTSISEVICPKSFLTSDFWQDTQFWQNKINKKKKNKKRPYIYNQ